MEFRIGLIRGDGIGPEIVTEAKRFSMPSLVHMGIHFTIQTFFWAARLLMRAGCL